MTRTQLAIQHRCTERSFLECGDSELGAVHARRLLWRKHHGLRSDSLLQGDDLEGTTVAIVLIVSITFAIVWGSLFLVQIARGL